MIAILHNIRSLHNVGSIFRTADAAGIEKIYLAGITPEPVDIFGRPRPQLTKVALGGEKSVPWEKFKNTAKLLEKLKNDGYKIFAIEQSKKSVPYYSKEILRGVYTERSRSVQNDKKIALVVGNEVKGLSPAILKKANKILEIPMHGKKESLNVSVAAGIILFGAC